MNIRMEQQDAPINEMKRPKFGTTNEVTTVRETIRILARFLIQIDFPSRHLSDSTTW